MHDLHIPDKMPSTMRERLGAAGRAMAGGGWCGWVARRMSRNDMRVTRKMVAEWGDGERLLPPDIDATMATLLHERAAEMAEWSAKLTALAHEYAARTAEDDEADRAAAAAEEAAQPLLKKLKYAHDHTLIEII
jgi:hypothetical protein